VKKPRLVTHSARIDIRSLATIATWLASNGIRPTNKSEAIHYGLEALSEMIAKNGGQLFDTVEDALLALSEFNITYTADQNSKTGRELFGALKLEGFGSVQHTQKRANLENQFNDALNQLIEAEVQNKLKEEKNEDNI
jgi:hypothetical protein